jgi:hypothetical protein
MSPMHFLAWVRFTVNTNHMRSVDLAVNETDPDLRGRSSGTETRIRSARLRIGPLGPFRFEIVHLKRRVHTERTLRAKSVATRTARSVRTHRLTIAQQMVVCWIMFAVREVLQRDKSQQPAHSNFSAKSFFQTFWSAFAASQWQQDYYRGDLFVMGSVYRTIIM